jgi:hypothetical protein
VSAPSRQQITGGVVLLAAVLLAVLWRLLSLRS